MAARAVAILAAAMMLVVTLLAGGASAQSPSPSSQCTSVLVSLSPCLNYISGNESTAPASCCSQLGKVVQSDPQCLCVALNADPASLGLNVNRTRVLGLPDACKVKTPDISNCKGAAAAPTSPSSGTPAGLTPASGATGSNTTPTTPGNGAAASPRGSAGLVAGFIVAAVLAVAAM
ncbi:non-specific lipid transfer protein GPI-anchored 5-like [Phragmites australis]|uniref:non-specific lipid transfer protein GPI-anchored 5-like n=1 Tax=Phragmites australis TaxID=29695 RepID=UPI002D774571|nr:non-specific lipid transfer protein GPI-anchored 5-like [Phragmites australis]